MLIFAYNTFLTHSFLAFSAFASFHLKSFLLACAMNRKLESLANSVIEPFNFRCPERSLIPQGSCKALTKRFKELSRTIQGCNKNCQAA